MSEFGHFYFQSLINMHWIRRDDWYESKKKFWNWRQRVCFNLIAPDLRRYRVFRFYHAAYIQKMKLKCVYIESSDGWEMRMKDISTQSHTHTRTVKITTTKEGKFDGKENMQNGLECMCLFELTIASLFLSLFVLFSRSATRLRRLRFTCPRSPASSVEEHCDWSTFYSIPFWV